MSRRPVTALLMMAAATSLPTVAASATPPAMLGNERIAAVTAPRLAPTEPSAPNSTAALYGGAMPRRDEPANVPTPQDGCGVGSRPEPGLQGRVPGGSVRGFTCNADEIGHEGATGGYKVERFTDAAGHVCAYYDTALVYPLNAVPDVATGAAPGGVAVLDMADPTHPTRTATLVTPAMLSPHESLLVNARRGLLAAALGNPGTGPGILDVYDLNADCRHPVLRSSTPLGVLGHESGFAPDGDTFYVTSLFTNLVTAIDLRDPSVPSIVWAGTYPSHALTLSDDGRRGYVAGFRGLQIIDLAQVQDRRPNPQVSTVSGLSWQNLTIPQNAIPVTIGGKRMLVETDEFAYSDQGTLATNGITVGAARIIDISDEGAPKVISNLRLAVNQPEHRAEIAHDPGSTTPGEGYAAHYCGVPQETDPGIVACSFISSGLRVFDIRDPYHPREIAYFEGPPKPKFGAPVSVDDANYAMSRPSFDTAHGNIWYSDANRGLSIIHITNGVWPFAAKSATGLPSTRRCVSRRVFTIHLRPGLRTATVTVAGRRVRVRRIGRRLVARVDLRGTRRTTITVTITARSSTRRAFRETRRYRTCAVR